MMLNMTCRKTLMTIVTVYATGVNTEVRNPPTGGSVVDVLYKSRVTHLS